MKGKHFSASCNVVKTVSERKAILIRNGRCFVCLKINHRAQSYNSNKSCSKFHRRHHQSLCDPPQHNSLNSNHSVNSQEVSTNTTNNVKDKKAILLQTAGANACNGEGSRKTKIHILFDNGSQRSYVTEMLKEKLKLSVIKKEKLHLNTFGSGQFRTQQCEMVQVRLTKPELNETIMIEALTFPTICTPLPPVTKIGHYPCLEELELADSLAKLLMKLTCS